MKRRSLPRQSRYLLKCDGQTVGSLQLAPNLSAFVFVLSGERWQRDVKVQLGQRRIGCKSELQAVVAEAESRRACASCTRILIAMSKSKLSRTSALHLHHDVVVARSRSSIVDQSARLCPAKAWLIVWCLRYRPSKAFRGCLLCHG